MTLLNWYHLKTKGGASYVFMGNYLQSFLWLMQRRGRMKVSCACAQGKREDYTYVLAERPAVQVLYTAPGILDHTVKLNLKECVPQYGQKIFSKAFGGVPVSGTGRKDEKASAFLHGEENFIGLLSGMLLR